MGARMGSWRAGLAPGPEPGAHRQRAQERGPAAPLRACLGRWGQPGKWGPPGCVWGREVGRRWFWVVLIPRHGSPLNLSLMGKLSGTEGPGTRKTRRPSQKQSSGSRNRADDGSGLSAQSEARPRRSPVDGCGRWSCPGSTAASRIPTGSPKTARTFVLGGRGDSAALELPEAHRDSPQPPRE